MATSMNRTAGAAELTSCDMRWHLLRRPPDRLIATPWTLTARTKSSDFWRPSSWHVSGAHEPRRSTGSRADSAGSDAVGRILGHYGVPRRLITDKLHSYAAAHRTVMPSVMHSTQQYENNRAEASHQPTRMRERHMRGFTSVAHAQRFLAVHGIVLNLFRIGRHLLRAVNHRLLRARAFGAWREATCA